LVVLTGERLPPAAAAFPSVNGDVVALRWNTITNSVRVIGINGVDVGGPGSGLVDVAQPAISPDGTIVALRSDGRSASSTTDIWITDLEGSLTRKVPSTANAYWPAWSPDGSKLAFANAGGIWIVPVYGSAELQLVVDSGTAPDWSPDGTKIAFRRNGIWSVNVDGTNEVNLSGLSAWSRPEWSPDATKITFGAGGEYADVFVMNADGSGLTNLTNDPEVSEFDPAWSPDGSRIAYVRHPASALLSAAEIWTMDPDGSDAVQLTNNWGSESAVDWQSAHSVPDGVIRHPTLFSDVGDGILNRTGIEQTVTGRMVRQGQADFSIRIEADGPIPGTFLVKGCERRKDFAVTYWKTGTGDVTKSIKQGTYETGTLAEGQYEIIDLEMRALATADRGTTRSCTVTTTSSTETGMTDAVKAVAKIKG